METNETPTPPPEVTPATMPEPRCSIHWTAARLTAPFLAALARGQERVKTVGKGGHNRDRDYNYATSDALLGELRRSFAPEGISFVHSWRTVNPPQLDLGENQWLTATVIIDWALLYGDKDGNIGLLTGTAECDAVGSKGRAPDKAMAAAKTYAIGFVAIGLAAIDRDEIPKTELVDDRKEDDRSRGPARTEPAPRDRARQAPDRGGPRSDPKDQHAAMRLEVTKCFNQLKRWKNMRELCGAAGVKNDKIDTMPLEDLRKVLEYVKAAVGGQTEPPHDPVTGEVG